MQTEFTLLRVEAGILPDNVLRATPSFKQASMLVSRMMTKNMKLKMFIHNEEKQSSRLPISFLLLVREA